MKHRILIAVSAIMISLASQAQSLWDASKPDHNFTFGLRGGINFANTDMDYATSSRTGFHFGATADWNIVKSFSLSTGLSYVRKGFKGDYGKGKMGYLQLPLLASYRIETPKGVWFHFNIGPYVAWGLSGKVDYKPYESTFRYDFGQDSFGDQGFFRHLDVGATAGAYILFGHVVAGLSYEYGLMDIAKVYGKFHNRNTCFTVGYNF